MNARIHPAVLSLAIALLYTGSCPTVSASNLPNNEAAQVSSTQDKPAIAAKKAPGKVAGKRPNGTDLSGTWYFASNTGVWHRGRIILKQSGKQLTGMWHTDVGKQEEDLPLYGNVDGNTVYLIRYGIWGDPNKKNTFTLSLCNGGNQLFGYGEGFFINHADLNMARQKKSGAERSR